MLDYASLATLAAIVREGSFERAGRALHITTSAVSQRIKLLEERLGTVLIARGQPCTATEVGRLLCRHVERVGMLEHDLREALPLLAGSAAADTRVTLRIAVNADSLANWFIGAMAEFTREHTALLDIAVDDQEHTVEWLRCGHVVAAVTSNPRPVQGCNCISLGRLPYVAVASAEFVRRQFPDGVNATALTSAPSLRFNSKDDLPAKWMRRVWRRDLETAIHWLPATHALLEATLAGIGWALNPQPLIEAHVRSGALVELVPGKPLLVPLYWQHTRLQVSLLDHLTRAVLATARTALRHSGTRSV